MVTALWFSAALTLADAPPPLLVITGASLTLVTVTDSVCVSTSEPSETWTETT